MARLSFQEHSWHRREMSVSGHSLLAAEQSGCRVTGLSQLLWEWSFLCHLTVARVLSYHPLSDPLKWNCQKLNLRQRTADLCHWPTISSQWKEGAWLELTTHGVKFYLLNNHFTEHSIPVRQKSLALKWFTSSPLTAFLGFLFLLCFFPKMVNVAFPMYDLPITLHPDEKIAHSENLHSI